MFPLRVFRGRHEVSFTGETTAKSLNVEELLAKAQKPVAEELARCAEERGLSEEYILPRMDEWEVFPREAAAVGMKAIKQGVARVIPTKDELLRKASQIIRKAQKESIPLPSAPLIPFAE